MIMKFKMFAARFLPCHVYTFPSFGGIVMDLLLNVGKRKSRR